MITRYSLQVRYDNLEKLYLELREEVNSLPLTSSEFRIIERQCWKLQGKMELLLELMTETE